MNEASSLQNSENSYFGDEIEKMEYDQNKNQIDISKTSSNPERMFDTVNKRIKYVIENGKDLSYSNSNSKISDQFQNKEQFLYSRYWCVNKKSNNDTDSSSPINENKKNNQKINLKENFKHNILKEEEKILYYNPENDDNENNKFNDDFDEEDMEEKTLEKKENGINEINSIKINNNNLNNKDSLTDKSNLDILSKNNSTINSNDKINISNTPNKLSQNNQNSNQSFIPYIYNTNQVQSFISSYNNYPSNLSKGSFISTNNSSNNKYKKNDEICNSEIEEEEMKNNINNNYTHGNKFGPHLMDYNHLQNNNLNLEQTNLTNLNNINSFNMNSNFMYNRIPKMNLNMVYYIPIQQQTIPNNNNFINNTKIIPNINNIITNNDNNSNNINLKSKNKESNNIINNNIKNGNNNNGNKIKEKEKSVSKEKKTKNKSTINNNNSNQKFENNNININNFRNNYNNNYKNNNSIYKNNDSHNSNINSNNNNNNCSKGEKNLLILDDIISGKDTRTTVMIRNIPIKYTDTILINALEEFKGKYDCLYMPYDYEKKGNKGYAFINFVNPLHILYFHEKFCGKKWPLFESSKICELNSANFQGINEIQKHSKNYKGYKKPLFYSEPNKSNVTNKENIIVPLKYLNKLKNRFPKMKFKENKAKKIAIIESLE
jgi:hypothetical protein